jgi:superoxide dismutase, Fe-Mn family
MAKFTPMPLPWDAGALTGFLSAEQNNHHYNDHYLEYIRKLNESDTGGMNMIELAVERADHIAEVAAQAWNHEFFWSILNPNARRISGRVYELIVGQYQSFERFQKLFEESVHNHFASGWVWFVYNKDLGLFMIIDGKDAYCPLVDGYVPLLTLDVWEHGFLRDYNADKDSYCKNMWRYVDWDKVNALVHDHIVAGPMSP